jgi:hypothetical protein
MGTTTTRWSRDAGRPKSQRPPSVASAEARSAWPAVDATLARRAIEYALGRTRAALRRHDIAAALLVDPVNVRYASGTSTMPVWTMHLDRPLPPGPGRRGAGAVGVRLGAPGSCVPVPRPGDPDGEELGASFLTGEVVVLDGGRTAKLPLPS